MAQYNAYIEVSTIKIIKIEAASVKEAKLIAENMEISITGDEVFSTELLCAVKPHGEEEKQLELNL